MTKELQAFSVKNSKRGQRRSSRYDPILDGKIYSITPRDFGQRNLKMLQINVCSLALRRGLKIKTQTVGKRLEVQMLGRR